MKNKDSEAEYDDLLSFDREHIWHPYSSMVDPLPVYAVRSAEGVYIELETGEKLIDGMSSWWSTIHGYNNPTLNQAAHAQIDQFSHVMFGGLTHRPAVNLARRVIEMTPEGLERVFYCDSGSVAVEIAIKMALQYMQAKGESTKTKIATVRGGYHGDTWHSMSVCDPDVGMHSLFSEGLPIQFFAPRPSTPFGGKWSDDDIEPLERLFEQHSSEIAAFIIEPIVQGASGMWIYHPHYLKRARELCDHYGILLIADEIATGFGRTGKMFACQWADIVPDIMTLGKAITGGYMSFAAVVTTSNVATTISKNPPFVFMHGPTFMGNPLACAVADASLKMLQDSRVLDRVAEIEAIMVRMLEPARSIASVADIRVLGAIGIIELREAVNMAQIQQRFVDEGVWIRPFGKLVYIMPPYIITDTQLEKLCRAMLSVIRSELNIRL